MTFSRQFLTYSAWAFCAALALGHASSQAFAQDAIAVSTSPVVQRNVPVNLNYVGATEAIRSITLQAKVAGFLMDGGAPDGSDVKKGDLLYRIDPRDFQATLDQISAQAARDNAALDYARANQGRSATLTQQGWKSKDALDQSNSALGQAKAALTADEAAIRTAKLNLSYTEIRAPFDGRIGRAVVHVGALITASGTTINSLVQLDPLYVTFNPSETDLPAILAQKAKGDVTAQVRVGDAGAAFKGTLTFIDNAVDRTTGTLVARLTIANPDKRVLPGQFVRIELQVDELKNALLIPQTALGSNQLGKYVYVAGSDGKAVRRIVVPKFTQGPDIVIAEGLKAGEQVVTSNLQKLSDGSLISVQNQAAKTN